MCVNELLKELNQVLEYYRLPETDIVYSGYNSLEDAINDMKSIINSLNNGDLLVLDKLSFLFAPTGSIQEISLDSGWSDEYIDISSRVDKLIVKLRNDQETR